MTPCSCRPSAAAPSPPATRAPPRRRPAWKVLTTSGPSQPLGARSSQTRWSRKSHAGCARTRAKMLAFSLGRYCLFAIAIGYARCKAWLRAPVDHAVLPPEFSLVVQPYRRAHRPAMRRRVQLCCTTRRAIPLARPSRGRGPAIGSPDAWARGGHWSALHGGLHRRGQMWVLLVTRVSRSDVSSCIERAAGNIQT